MEMTKENAKVMKRKCKKLRRDFNYQIALTYVILFRPIEALKRIFKVNPWQALKVVGITIFVMVTATVRIFFRGTLLAIREKRSPVPKMALIYTLNAIGVCRLNETFLSDIARYEGSIERVDRSIEYFDKMSKTL